MDRFIVNVSTASPTTSSLFKIQYGQIYRMKKSKNTQFFQYLKSNMDRFIVEFEVETNLDLVDLKSNMDRFIEQLQ